MLALFMSVLAFVDPFPGLVNQYLVTEIFGWGPPLDEE
jgi:hypothetical protein